VIDISVKDGGAGVGQLVERRRGAGAEGIGGSAGTRASAHTRADGRISCAKDGEPPAWSVALVNSALAVVLVSQRRQPVLLLLRTKMYERLPAVRRPLPASPAVGSLSLYRPAILTPA
jgi:hypothetical protein